MVYVSEVGRESMYIGNGYVGTGMYSIYTGNGETVNVQN